ncbi:MAG: hypothetical protein HFE49_04235 [Clostridia bacterium]|nr:hypothetical protein [Clostridia bacterium]
MYVITEEKKIIDNKERAVYGIRYDDEYFISDISADRESVTKLVSDFNAYKLDPVHLGDMAEDFINSL